jgi:hypothetical protein
MHTDTHHVANEFEKYVQDDEHYIKTFLAAYELMNTYTKLPDVKIRVKALLLNLEKRQNFYSKALEPKDYSGLDKK